jgi:hypothetical protein
MPGTWGANGLIQFWVCGFWFTGLKKIKRDRGKTEVTGTLVSGILATNGKTKCF